MSHAADSHEEEKDAEEVTMEMGLLGGKDGRQPVLRIRNVHKTYLLGVEGVPALRGVSLNVERGEIVMILGKSGSGKTSFLNLSGTIDKPTRGDMILFDSRITSETHDRVLAGLRLRHMAFVFQSFNLLPQMTALENVELPMVLAGWGSAADRRARATQLLTRVGMGQRLDHTPSQLSGGEQQRVTIARALANRPALLLLDEPTGDLDSRSSDVVVKLLMDLNVDDGVAMLMVTHDVGLKAFAHRVVHMLDGKVHRIERTPDAVRNEALRQLGDRLRAGPKEVVAADLQRAPRDLSECRHTLVRDQAHYGDVTV